MEELDELFKQYQSKGGKLAWDRFQLTHKEAPEEFNKGLAKYGLTTQVKKKENPKASPSGSPLKETAGGELPSKTPSKEAIPLEQLGEDAPANYRAVEPIKQDPNDFKSSADKFKEAEINPTKGTVFFDYDYQTKSDASNYGLDQVAYSEKVSTGELPGEVVYSISNNLSPVVIRGTEDKIELLNKFTQSLSHRTEFRGKKFQDLEPDQQRVVIYEFSKEFVPKEGLEEIKNDPARDEEMNPVRNAYLSAAKGLFGVLEGAAYGIDGIVDAATGSGKFKEAERMKQKAYYGAITKKEYSEWAKTFKGSLSEDDLKDVKLNPPKYENISDLNINLYDGIELGPEVSKAVQGIPTNPNYQGNFLSDVLPQGIGSLAAFAASGGVAGAASLGAMSNGGSLYREALENGANTEDSYKALFVGMGVGASESLSLSKYFGRVQGRLGNTFKNKLTSVIKEGAEEGLQEVMMDVANNITAQQIYDETRDILNDESLNSFLVGQITGSMLSAATTKRAESTPEDKAYIDKTIDLIKEYNSKDTEANKESETKDASPESAKIKTGETIELSVEPSNSKPKEGKEVALEMTPESKPLAEDKFVYSRGGDKTNVKDIEEDKGYVFSEDAIPTELENVEPVSKSTINGKETSLYSGKQIIDSGYADNASKEAEPAVAQEPSEVPLDSETKTDSKGRTWTYFEDTKTKDGLIKTNYTFNRSDNPSTQRNTAGINPGIAITDKGYKVAEGYIPEGTKIKQVYEVIVDAKDPSKAGATVEFIDEDGDTFRADVQLEPKSAQDVATPTELKPIAEQTTEDLEKEQSKIEDSKIPMDRSRFNEIEKELEAREWGSVLNSSLEEIGDVIDNLAEKEKTMPNGFGSYIESKDARETKSVAKKYLGDVDKGTAKKDFKDSFFGSPSSWYADALKMRESVRVFIEKGGTFKDLLTSIQKEFEYDGFSEKEAAGVIKSKLNEVNKRGLKSQSAQDVAQDNPKTNEQEADKSIEPKRDKADSRQVEPDGKPNTAEAKVLEETPETALEKTEDGYEVDHKVRDNSVVLVTGKDAKIKSDKGDGTFTDVNSELEVRGKDGKPVSRATRRNVLLDRAKKSTKPRVDGSKHSTYSEAVDEIAGSSENPGEIAEAILYLEDNAGLDEETVEQRLAEFVNLQKFTSKSVSEQSGGTVSSTGDISIQRVSAKGGTTMTKAAEDFWSELDPGEQEKISDQDILNMMIPMVMQTNAALNESVKYKTPQLDALSERFETITGLKPTTKMLRSLAFPEDVAQNADLDEFNNFADIEGEVLAEKYSDEQYIEGQSAVDNQIKEENGESTQKQEVQPNDTPRAERGLRPLEEGGNTENPSEVGNGTQERGDGGETGYGRGWDKSRGDQTLEGAPIRKGATGANAELTDLAEEYAKKNGIPYKRQSKYVEVDVARATKLAVEYEAMEHNPSDPAVKEAFQNLIAQTTEQYNALVAAGYKFFLIDGTNDPYEGNPWNAMRDLRGSKQMGVFSTESGFGSDNTDIDVENSPMLADTGLTWGYGSVDGPPRKVFANDLFRAVHDAFGHGLEGSGFRARGEENAWQAHSRLFTGSALGALATETRGQNSWVNFGEHGEHNRSAQVEDTIFADQKTGLMPEWTWTEGVDKGTNEAKPAPKNNFFEKNKTFFHASDKKRKGRLNKNNARQFGTGVYFSTNKDLVANEFGEYLTEVELTVSNPVYTNTKEWNEVSKEAIRLADIEYGKRKGLTLDEEDTYFAYDYEDLSAIDEIPSKHISDAAKKLGYDAIVDEDSNTYGDEIIVLDESKIIYEEDKVKSKEASKDYGESNKQVTKKDYESLKAQMRAAMNNANSGVNPEALALAAKMAAYHIEAGSRKFAEFSKAMVADIGESIRPNLQDLFDTASKSIKANNVRSSNAEKEGIISKAKETGDYLKAPNGENTNLDADLWVHVRTEEFKKWFGDWENRNVVSSKIKDKNGEPLVVYHGTDRVIDKFNPNSLTRNSRNDAMEGVWFTNTKDNASNFAFKRYEDKDSKQTIMDVFLNIRVPLTIDFKDKNQIENLIKNQYTESEWKNYFRNKYAEKKWNVPRDLLDKAINKARKNRLYDGVIFEDFKDKSLSDQYLLFNSENNIEIVGSSTPDYGTSNKGVSESAYEKAKADFKKSFGQLNSGLNPEALALAAKMAAYHIEAGSRKFAEFSKAMVEDIGDAIKPHLQDLFDTAKKSLAKEKPKGPKKLSYIKRVLKDYAGQEKLLDAVEEAGTEYEPVSHKQVNPIADKIIEEALASDDVTAAMNEIADSIEDTTIADYRANPLLATLQSLMAHKVINHFYKVGDSKNFAKWSKRYADIGKSFGQFNSAMQNSASPEALTNNAIAQVQQDKAEAMKGNETEVKELEDFVNKLQSDLATEVANSKALADKIEKLMDQAATSEKAPTPKTNREKVKKVAAAIRSIKFDSSLTFSQVVPITPVLNAALEIAAKAVEAGGSVADAIAKGLRYIKASKEYKAYQKHQQEKVDKVFTDKISEEYTKSKKTQNYVSPADIAKVIESHYAEGNAKAKTLFDKLVEETGIDPKIAKEVEAEVVAEIQKGLETQLNKKFGLDKEGNPVTKKEAKKNATVTDSIVEAVKYGALDSSKFQDHFADKFGFPKMTPGQVAKIEEMVGYIFSYNGSEMSFKKKKELADYIHSLRPLDSKKFFDIARGLIIRAALSGYNTIAINIPIGSLLSYSFNMVPKFAMNPTAYFAARKAWKEMGLKGMGRQSFGDVFKSGFNVLDLAGQKFDGEGTMDGDTLDHYINNYSPSDIWASYDNKATATIAIMGRTFLQTFKISNFAGAFDVLMTHKGSEMVQFIDEFNEISKQFKGKPLPKGAMSVAEVVRDNLGYNRKAEIKEQIKEEVEEMEADGTRVTSGYKKRRIKELMEATRQQEKVAAALEFAKFSTLMNNPDGVFGRFYEKARDVLHIKGSDRTKETGVSKATFDTVKWFTNASVALFLRIGVTSAQAIARNTPVLGLSSAITGRRMTKVDGNWGWHKMSPKERKRRLIENLTTSAMTTAAFLSMFDYDDEEEGWVLDPDRLIDITGKGTGDWKDQEQISGLDEGGLDKFENFQLRIKINGDWVDIMPAKLIPQLLPTIAILGNMSDRQKFPDISRGKFKEGSTAQKLNLSAANKALQDVVFSTTELSFNAIPQLLNSMMYAAKDAEPIAAMGEVFLKTAVRPLKTIAQPNIIRDTYQTILAETQTPVRTGAKNTKTIVSNLYGLEYFSYGGNMKNRTDMFGYEVIHNSPIGDVMSAIPFVEFQKANEFRYDEAAWTLMAEHPSVHISTHWARGEDDNEKLRQHNVWALGLRRRVEENYDVLKSSNDADFLRLLTKYSGFAKKEAKKSKTKE